MQNPDFANWLGAYTFPSSSFLVFSCLSILLTSRLLNETMLQECVQTLQIIFPSYRPILSCWPPQPPRVQCSGKGIVDSLPDSQAIANAAQHIETKSASGEGQIVKSSHPTLSPRIMEVENGWKWLYLLGNYWLEGPIFQFHDHGRKGRVIRPKLFTPRRTRMLVVHLKLSCALRCNETF